MPVARRAAPTPLRRPAKLAPYSSHLAAQGRPTPTMLASTSPRRRACSPRRAWMWTSSPLTRVGSLPQRASHAPRFMRIPAAGRVRPSHSEALTLSYPLDCRWLQGHARQPGGERGSHVCHRALGCALPACVPASGPGREQVRVHARQQQHCCVVACCMPATCVSSHPLLILHPPSSAVAP